jgi:hypothetical protein
MSALESVRFIDDATTVRLMLRRRRARSLRRFPSFQRRTKDGARGSLPP